MASAANQVNPSVPRFDGVEFGDWSIMMRTFFISQDLWELVSIGYSEEGLTAGALRETRKKDAKALSHIQQAVDTKVFKRISSAETANDAWCILKTTY